MKRAKCNHIWGQIGWAINGKILSRCKCGTIRVGDAPPYSYLTPEYMIIHRDERELSKGKHGKPARRMRDRDIIKEKV